MSFITKLFWKLYFIFIIFIFFRLTFPWHSKHISGTIDIFMMVPSLVGLYGLAFDKEILHKKLWRLYWLTLVTWDFYYHFVIGYFLSGSIPFGQVVYIMITLVPLYAGLFIYAFLTDSEHAVEPA